MGSWRQVPSIPSCPPQGQSLPSVTANPAPLGHALTLLGWSPPLREVPSQKQQMPLSCRAGCWAQLSKGTRSEDVWL